MSLATVSAQQTAATATSQGAASPGAASPGAASPGAANARATLAGNFDNFLKLLMTQLKNQDPTSPLDANQFTAQLVQFAGVEQQINANTSLTKLIELTQGEQVLQASNLVGRRVAVGSDHIPLQNGAGQIGFTAATARPVAISIATEAGAKVRDVVIPATAGDNQWAWDGRNNAGARVPDGSYRIALRGVNADGTLAEQAFTVQGMVTGITRENGAARLQLGPQVADITAVQQVMP